MSGVMRPVVIAAILLLPWGAAPAGAQPRKIEIAYSAISATQAVLWFTKEAGVFEKPASPPT